MKLFQKEILECRDCKDRLDLPALPGSGNEKAKILFVGMNPSYRRSKETDAAFVGLEGLKFRVILKKSGINEDMCYITNLAKCSFYCNSITENNCNKCLKFLLNEIKTIKPKIVVALGNVVHEYLVSKKIECVKIYHPNYITSYNPQLETEYVATLKEIRGQI